MESSYIPNNFGDLIYSYVTGFEPRVLVEIGVLYGYSTEHIIRGMKYNGHGHLDCYDLFEKYPYKHTNYEDINKKFYPDKDWVTIHQEDAFTVHEHYEDRSVDFIHIDVSNTGTIFNKMIELWTKKLRYGSILAFEGGSQERDNIEWMKKYNMEPIKTAMENNAIVLENYRMATYLPFPSMTFFLKKTD